MNIHDRARQMVTQSRTPMTLSEAYSALAKRRRASKPKTIALSPVATRPAVSHWWMRD